MYNEIYSLIFQSKNIEKEKKLKEYNEKLTKMFSTYSHIKEISEIVNNKQNDNRKNKIKQITLKDINSNEQVFFNWKTINILTKLEIERELKPIDILALPIKMENNKTVLFKSKEIKKIRVITTKEQHDLINKFYLNKEELKIKITPIVKFGEEITIKKARLNEFLS